MVHTVRVKKKVVNHKLDQPVYHNDLGNTGSTKNFAHRKTTYSLVMGKYTGSQYLEKGDSVCLLFLHVQSTVPLYEIYLYVVVFSSLRFSCFHSEKPVWKIK